jgi:hypothetical protein
VLRHLPYFGDDDNEEFDYLSLYESAEMLRNNARTGLAPHARAHPQQQHVQTHTPTPTATHMRTHPLFLR